MLLPSSRFKIFMYPKAFDMRSGYDRLAMICKEELGLNPYSGALFLFFNKTLTRAKIFFFDGSGSCLFLKRLEKGRFKAPLHINNKHPYILIESSELALLLDGADVSKVIKPKKWHPPNIENEDEV